MTDASDTFAGGCACGAVRFRMESAPLFVHCCHCHWCQRESGASFALNAMIEADRVTVLQGEPVPVPTPSNSGKGQTIWRCPECRVALWSNYAGAIHIFTASKQPWVVLPEGQPAVEAYYSRREYWPQDSLARREILFGKQAGTS